MGLLRPALFLRHVLHSPSFSAIQYRLAPVAVQCCKRHYAQKHESAETVKEEPVKYSTSGAKYFQSYDTFTAPVRDVPRYQAPIVIASVVIFLVYFTILREESDWDEEINKSLYERIPGLEEVQLRQSIQAAAAEGKDTAELQARLRQILAQK